MNARQVIEAEDPKSAFKSRFKPSPWPEDALITQTAKDLGFTITKHERGGNAAAWTEYHLTKQARTGTREYKFVVHLTVWQPQPNRVYISVSRANGVGEFGTWVRLIDDQVKGVPAAMAVLRYAMGFIAPKLDTVPAKHAAAQAKSMAARWMASRVAEAEDPKAFFKKQMPLVDIARQTPARRCGICGAKTAYSIRIEGVKLPICRDCHRSGFLTPLLRSRQEAEDPKTFMRKHAPRQFEVEGEHKSWIVNHTGKVGCALGTPLAKRLNIEKFNVEEYRQRTGRWPEGTVKLDQISYWDDFGHYYACGGEVYNSRRPRQESEDPKAFLKDVAPQPILVSCYMGQWTADRRTGMVKSWDRDYNIHGVGTSEREFDRWAADRVAFDFDEWEKYWGRPADREIDICDIGSWDSSGAYEPAEAEYRKEQAQRDAQQQQEAEDPKSVFGQLNRPTEVTREDMSLEERPDAEHWQYRWTAMWRTPFIIANRQRIRGCPAGTGATAIGAIKDLLVRTNQESKTMFYVKFKGDPFPTFARGVIEAESPKKALQQFKVQSGPQFWMVDPDGYITDTRSVPGTNYDDLRMVAHFDVNDYIDRNGHRPHGVIQLTDIAYWTKYSGQRVPAGMKINYPRGHRNPL